MKVRADFERLLEALADDQEETLIELLEEFGEEARTAEVIREVPLKMRGKLHAGLSNKVMAALNAISAAQEALAAPEADAPADLAAATPHRTPAPRRVPPPEAEASLESATDLLVASAVVARLVAEDHAAQATNDLADSLELLHDTLLSAPLPDASDAICRACEAYYLAGGLRKECVMPQMVPYLIMRAMASNRPADVKRCLAVGRTALAAFDYEDESIEDLKRLYLRAAFSPAFLKTADGRKFIALLFNLQPALVRELFAIIKNQLPACNGRRSVVEAYGEVIFRAWESSQGACRLELEEHVVKGLAEGTLYTASRQLAASVREVLGHFHQNKKKKGVDTLLTATYDPVLLAALAAPNAAVRLNALALLEGAYPIQDPEASADDTSALLDRQHSLLLSLMADECPAIRAAAVGAAASILDRFWEVVPPASATAILRRMAAELATDPSSPAVRVAALDALRSLVDNPLAHPALARLLPPLSSLLQDANPKARLHYCYLLMAVSRVRGLKVSDMASPADLLESMALEAQPGPDCDAAVAALLHRLIAPSILGGGAESGAAALAQLLRDTPQGAVAFCRYLCCEGPQGGGRGVKRFLVSGGGVAFEKAAEVAVLLKEHLLRSAPQGPAGEAVVVPAKQAGKRRRRADGGGDAAAGPGGGADAMAVVEKSDDWSRILRGWVEAVLALHRAAGGDGQLEASVVQLVGGRTLPSLLHLAPTPASRLHLLRLIAPASSLLPPAQLRESGGDRSIAEACLDTLEAAGGGAGDAGDAPLCLEELGGAARCAMAVAAARDALVRGVLAALSQGIPEVADSAAASPLAPAAATRRAGAKTPKLTRPVALLALSGLLAEPGSRAQLLAHPSVEALMQAVEATVKSDAGPSGDAPPTPTPSAPLVLLRLAAHLDARDMMSAARGEGAADRAAEAGGAAGRVCGAVSSVAALVEALGRRMDAEPGIIEVAIADPPPARPPLGAVPNGAPGPASLEAGWRRNKKSKKGEEAEAADAAGAVEAAAVGKLVLRTLEASLAALSDTLALRVFPDDAQAAAWDQAAGAASKAWLSLASSAAVAAVSDAASQQAQAAAPAAGCLAMCARLARLAAGAGASTSPPAAPTSGPFRLAAAVLAKAASPAMAAAAARPHVPALVAALIAMEPKREAGGAKDAPWALWLLPACMDAWDLDSRGEGQAGKRPLFERGSLPQILLSLPPMLGLQSRLVQPVLELAASAAAAAARRSPPPPLASTLEAVRAAHGGLLLGRALKEAASGKGGKRARALVPGERSALAALQEQVAAATRAEDANAEAGVGAADPASPGAWAAAGGVVGDEAEGWAALKGALAVDW